MDIGDKLKITLGTILIVGIIAVAIVSIGFSMNNKDKPGVAMSRENYQIQTHTIDSLQRTIDSLQLEIKVQGDGFDYKELRYEEIIFRYELGIEHIKHYHREAYEEFVRISQFKERYDRETEREFKQRNDLKTIKINEKWN
jgi:hypothetical protein